MCSAALFRLEIIETIIENIIGAFCYTGIWQSPMHFPGHHSFFSNRPIIVRNVGMVMKNKILDLIKRRKDNDLSKMWTLYFDT